MRPKLIVIDLDGTLLNSQGSVSTRTADALKAAHAAGIANSAARILPRGTVCFSRTASVGFVVIMDKPMATSQDFANWVCGEDLDPEFLMHALIRSRKELRAIATGATHKTIYMPALESFHVCLPDRPAQARIVKRLRTQLEAIDEMRQSIQARLADLERLPARLLAEAFSPDDDQSEDVLKMVGHALSDEA